MASRTKFQGLTAPADTVAQRDAVEALFADRLDQRRVLPQDIRSDMIVPNPFQARKRFANLDQLAQAIQAQGFTSRLRVRPAPGMSNRYELVFGERRWRAAQIAGLNVLPCDVGDHTDEDMIEIGLAENIQRQDLDPLEEAQAFRTFIDERGYSIRRLAERIGKDKGYVQGRLELLAAPDDVQDMVAERPDTIDAARQISKLDDPIARQALIDGVTNHTLSSRDVRAAVRERIRGGLQLPQLGETSSSVSNLASAAVLSDIRVPTRTLHDQIARDQALIGEIAQRWNTALTNGDALTRDLLYAALEASIIQFSLLLQPGHE